MPTVAASSPGLRGLDRRASITRRRVGSARAASVVSIFFTLVLIVNANVRDCQGPLFEHCDSRTCRPESGNEEGGYEREEFRIPSAQLHKLDP